MDSRPFSLAARKGLLLLPVAALALTLSACGGDKPAEPKADQPPASAPATPGAAPSKPATDLEAIKVEGEPGKEPKVTVPAPWGIDETKVKVLTPGNGPVVHGMAEVNYSGVNARTGKKFDDSFSKGQSATFPLDQVIPGFKKGLENQKVGSRVLIAMPGKDGYDSSGGSKQIGIEVGDTLLFVVDILGTPLEAAQGDPVTPPPGLPTVAMEGAKPKVTLPATPPPDKLVVQPLIKGKGKPVQAADSVTVRYQATTWQDNKVVEETYGKDPESGPLQSLVPAWVEGLANQPVGSRVMIIAPPDKAYPANPNDKAPNPAAGKTVVYVVDILFAATGG